MDKMTKKTFVNDASPSIDAEFLNELQDEIIATQNAVTEAEVKVTTANNSLNALPIIKSGSKVVSCGAGSLIAQLFTEAELKSELGITSFDKNNLSITATNGDTAAYNGHMIGTEINTSNKYAYVILRSAPTAQTNMRVNYTLFYKK